jgi:hypothetical protein
MYKHRCGSARKIRGSFTKIMAGVFGPLQIAGDEDNVDASELGFVCHSVPACCDSVQRRSTDNDDHCR